MVKYEDPPKPDVVYKLMLEYLLSQLCGRVVPVYSRQGPATLESLGEVSPTTHKQRFPIPTALVWFQGSAGLQCRTVYHTIPVSVDTAGLTQQQWSSFTDCVGGNFICQLLKGGILDQERKRNKR